MDNLLPQLKISHTKGELWDVAVATGDGIFASASKKSAQPDPAALRAKLRTNFEHKRSSKKLAGLSHPLYFYLRGKISLPLSPSLPSRPSLSLSLSLSLQP